MIAVEKRAYLIRMTLLALLVCVALLLAACGGEDDLSEGIIFDFSDLEPAEVSGEGEGELLPNVFARLDIDPERLVRISYLHDMQSLTNELQVASRSLTRVVDGGSNDPGLDWVIAVHDAHRISEDLRVRGYGFALPEVLEEDYIDFHVSYLEGLQVYGQSVDRLLEAALLLGPGGRTVSEMTRPESVEFSSLLAEVRFFSADAEVLIARAVSDSRRLVGELRLR